MSTYKRIYFNFITTDLKESEHFKALIKGLEKITNSILEFSNSLINSNELDILQFSFDSSLNELKLLSDFDPLDQTNFRIIKLIKKFNDAMNGRDRAWYKKQWNLENKEYHNQWREKNKNYFQDYYELNKKLKNKELDPNSYYAKNKERLKEYSKLYYRQQVKECTKSIEKK